MNVAEKIEGCFRVYAAAPDAAGGGFHAAVVVRKWAPSRGPVTEVFRDERLEDGAVWPLADVALAFALEVGVAAIHAQQVMRDYRRQVRSAARLRRASRVKPERPAVPMSDETEKRVL